MFNKILAYSILLAFPLTAFATDKPPAPPLQEQDQSQKQYQSQDQDQHQGQQQSQAVSQSASQANSQSVNFDGSDRSVALGQGSIYIPDCGAGGNAGGGDNGSVGFLGWTYVPAWCQDFQYAAWLLSVGDYEAACEVMAKSKVGKRAAKKGIRAPVCSGRTAKAVSGLQDSSQSVQPQTPVDLSQYALRTEVLAVKAACAESNSRAVERCIAK